MYMRDTTYQIDSGVIISFLKAVLQRFMLIIAGAAAKNWQTDWACFLGKEKTPSDHLMHSAHACLVTVNYATNYVFTQLQENQKSDRHTRTCDYRLLLQFILSNLFREEVDEHNSRHRSCCRWGADWRDRCFPAWVHAVLSDYCCSDPSWYLQIVFPLS